MEPKPAPVPVSEVIHDGFFRLERVKIEGHPYEHEIVRATDSVAILVYVSDVEKILLVKQERPALISKTNPKGEIIELVAGRFDGNYYPLELAIKELGEELGVTNIEERDIIFISNLPLAVNSGMTNERCFLAFAKITGDNVDQSAEYYGLEEEGEKIKRVWMTVSEFKNYIPQDIRLFAMQQWFFANRPDFQRPENERR